MGSKAARLVIVADVNLPRAKQQADKYGGEACQDYRRALDRKDIDAVLTATPDNVAIKNHILNWLECAKSRAKPVADVAIAHRSVTLGHLGNIARWTGRKLRWDPVQEIFPDDAEANKYLDYERRKPYVLPEHV